MTAERLDSLAAIERACWDELARAMREQGHAWRVMTLATVDAGRAAMERAGAKPDEIDLVILATTTPDRQVPASASRVQAELGLKCGAFDLNAACSGFVYGMVAAQGFIKSGLGKILVIGSETLSTIVDWEDRVISTHTPVVWVLSE